MKKIAVIDIGSNSVRLMTSADGKVLYKTLETTQLGEGIANSPVLLESAMQRTAQAVANFAARAKNEGVEEVYAFATAAVRSATNGADFVRKVKALCGVEIEVLSGNEEAEIGIKGALGERDGGIIDIGGASTEIIVRKKGKTLYEKSVDIGVVRLKDRCGRELSSLQSAAKEAVKEYGEVPKGATMYAIGGTATTIAAVLLDLKEYDGAKVSGLKLNQAQIQGLISRLVNTTVDELASHPCVPRKRAEVLLGGVVWLLEIMQAFGFEEVVVSDSDNLEGYAIVKGLL